MPIDPIDPASLRNLVAQGRLRQAIDALRTHAEATQHPDHNALVLLRARFVRNEQQYLASLITHQEHGTELARVSHAFMEILSHYEPTPPLPPAAKPTFLMAFAANDLGGVKREYAEMWAPVSESILLQARKVENASIETLADAVLASPRLAFFHYGGHMGPNTIVLDAFQHVDGERLLSLLAPQTNMHPELVVLNGCLSFGHVGRLTANGVKAVIATNVPVQDARATRLAKFFYSAFCTRGMSLQGAFGFAEATAGSGANSVPILVRPGQSIAMPTAWTLFINANTPEVADWTLADFVKHAR